MSNFNDLQMQLAAWTFFANSHPSDTSCPTSGLPLTLNSVKIYGRFQLLKSLTHPTLCQYLDIIRGHYERLIVISQYCGQTLDNYINTNLTISIEAQINLAYKALNAIKYFSSYGIVHRNLNPQNILILDNECNNVKLFNYGFYYLTDSGQHSSFQFGKSKYSIPETIIAEETDKIYCYDTWSLGMILAELSFSKKLWQKFTKFDEFTNHISQLIKSKSSIFEQIAFEHDCCEEYETLPIRLRNLIEDCLQMINKEFLTLDDLLNRDLFKDQRGFENKDKNDNNLRTLPSYSIKEFYHWWQLADGDPLRDLKAMNLIASPNSIKYTLENNNDFQEMDERVAKISLHVLKEKFDNIQKIEFFPLIHSKLRLNDKSTKFDKFPDFEVLIHRENNLEYQFRRMILFRRLLHGYPFTVQDIINESHIDIPPLYRGEIWAAILNVRKVHVNIYDTIDKVSEIPTDRQIAVDVPRCHQYNDLMSSPDGHAKLKRILKAWVVYHTRYVYWQGLDSLSAPFLYLNFSNEAKAFASVSMFIDKYLHKFFLKDNGEVIEEYLRKFLHLIAFHDPLLAYHLEEINFVPELFSIPWFLTMFSHIFPLHKIMHLWDKLLLCDSSFPLHVGLALLNQIRETLLTLDFNECILLFSDLPDFDIAECVSFSLQTYNLTPKSISERYHSTERAPIEKKEFATISQLKNEICSRIDLDDFLDFINRFSLDEIKIIFLYSNNMNPDVNSFDYLKVKMDVINFEKFNLTTVFGKNGLSLINHNFKLVVIASVDDDCAIKLAKCLIKEGVTKVCVFKGGIKKLETIIPIDLDRH